MSNLIDAFALLPAQLRAIFDLDAAAMRLAIRKLHRDVEATLDAAADKCNESAPGETYESLLHDRNQVRTANAGLGKQLDALHQSLVVLRGERDAARGEAQHYMAELNECQDALEKSQTGRDRLRDELAASEQARASLGSYNSNLRTELDRLLNQLRVAFDENDKLRERIAARTDHTGMPPAAHIGLAMRVLHAAPGKLCRPEGKAELDGVVDWLRSFGPAREPDVNAPWPRIKHSDLRPETDGQPMTEPAPLTPTGELEALQKQVARLESRLECCVRHDERRITNLEERVFDELGERVRKLEAVAHAPQPVTSADDVELLWRFIEDFGERAEKSIVSGFAMAATKALQARMARKHHG
jgi:predicted nuclease with TOPRIM domain